MVRIVAIMLMLNACQSMRSTDDSELANEQSAPMCTDIIRKSKAVEIVMDSPDYDSRLTIGETLPNSLIVDEVERLAQAAVLVKNEPLIDFRKACALKCLAYQAIAETTEKDLCAEGRQCDAFRDFMLTYGRYLDLQFGRTEPESETHPLTLRSEKDGVWYALESKRGMCRFRGPPAKDLAISFYHPARKLKVELRHREGQSLLMRRVCDYDPCVLENEAIKFTVKKDTYRHHGEIRDSGKFILFSELKDGQELLLKVDDCVAEIKNTDGTSESLFPKDDVSCLNLEKVKQSLLHPL